MNSPTDELDILDFASETFDLSYQLDSVLQSPIETPPGTPEPPALADNSQLEELFVLAKDLFKFRFGNFNPWANEYIEILKRKNFLIDEMTGSFVGSMPVPEFLRRFVGYRVTMDDLPEDYDFSEISGTGGEVQMYQTICDAINESGLCPGFKTVIVANEVDKHGIRLRPDLAMLPDGASDDTAFAYNNMDFWLEVKAGRAADAFSETGDPNTVEKNNGDSTATRGQLISYAAAVLSRQHRLHLFSVLICDHYARFARWDRSGCLISEQFDFHERPELLAYFFWCYSKLSRIERGFDPTVQPATKSEGQLLRRAVAQYEKDCEVNDRQNVTAIQKPKEAEHPWPTYRVQVDVNGESRKFIIGRPFWGSDSPCGRATRGYAAYDLFAKKLVFLKDSWRTESTRVMPEGVMYAKLRRHYVPFLPDVLAAGDVKFNNKIQKTVTQHYANKPFPPAWRSPCSRLDTLIHYRIVQELAFPLVSAVSSREVVQAMRDIIEAIKIAYHSGKILHRDISLGNVMISKSGRGCLNDWDHAIELALRGTKHSFRTGTWQFISSSLLGDPSKHHEIHDDLESCFWVLLKVALHYFKHEGMNFDIAMFNEYFAPRDEAPATGGNAKRAFITQIKIRPTRWACVPLNDLLHELAVIFSRFLRSADDCNDFADGPSEERYKQKYRELEEVDIVLQCFDRALASCEWPAGNDAVKDQFRPITPKQADQSRRDTITGNIATEGKRQSSHLMLTRKRTISKIQLENTQSSKRPRTVQRSERGVEHFASSAFSVPELRLPPPPPPPARPAPKRHSTNTRLKSGTKLQETSQASNGDRDVGMPEASGPGRPYRLRSSKSNESKRRREAEQGSTGVPKPVKIARIPALPRKPSTNKRGKSKQGVCANVPKPNVKGKKPAAGSNSISRRVECLLTST